MKLSFILGLALLLTACSSPQNKYEQAIANFVQTDKKGTKYDMKFKVIEFKELQKITVADSVNILKETFEAEKEKKIEGYSQTVERNKQGLENEEKNRFKSAAMIKHYTDNISQYKQALDSVSNLKFPNPYEAKKPDEVLAILVECKYSVVPPMLNTTAEETREFVLSPDGTKCYKGRRIKK